MIQTVIAVNVLVRKPTLGRVAQVIEPVCVLPAKERHPVPRHGVGIQLVSFRRKGRPPELADRFLGDTER